ncbi:MAG: hypothetical protein ACEPOV_07340 [Hyphomicrobiales bacterium]
MNKAIYKIWESDDKKIRFKFKINIIQELDIEEAVCSYEYFISPSEKPITFGDFLIDNKHPLILDECIEDFIIKGYIKVEYNKQQPKSHFIILGDISYGLEHELKAFKGTMVYINVPTDTDTIVPDDDYDIIDDDNPDVPDAFVPETETDQHIVIYDLYNNVFPFISIYNDTMTEKEEISFSFIEYNPVAFSPPSNTFISDLIQYKESGNYEAITDLAKEYINNEFPKYKFIDSRKYLDTYTSNFLSILEELRFNFGYQDIIQNCCHFSSLTIEELYQYLKSPLYLEQKEEVWNSYIASVIVGSQTNNTISFLTETLKACNLIEKLLFNLNEDTDELPFSTDIINDLISARVVLPNALFPIKQSGTSPSQDKDSICLWIGELQVIKQKLIGYEIGEIANIISIMPHEERTQKKKKRNKTKELLITEVEEVHSLEKENNYNQDELLKEAINKLLHTKRTYNYNNFKTTYGPPTNLTLDGNYTIDQEVLSPDGFNSSDFAKKLIENLKSEISKVINNKRSVLQQNEYEELQKSSIDNTQSSDILNGIYHWLNKTYNAKLVKYGERLMLKIKIDNPSKNLKEYEWNYETQLADKPLSPESKFNIKSFEDITVDNYKEICSYYKIIDFELPPKQNKNISIALADDQSRDIEIPEGYQAMKAEVTVTKISDQQEVYIAIGSKSIKVDSSTSLPVEVELNKEDESLAVSQVCSSIISSPPSSLQTVQVNINIDCQITDKRLDEWKCSMYKLFHNAYSKQKELYLSAYQAEETNNNQHELLIQKSLVSEGINTIIESVIPYHPDEAEKLKSYYAESLINQALEWNEMNYYLYHANSKINIDYAIYEQKNLLVDFIQAESADIIVPVHPNYNIVLLYFLQSGEIWKYDENTTPVFHDQITLCFHLEKHFVKTEASTIDTWNYCIPTNLKILSDDSSNSILYPYNK